MDTKLITFLKEMATVDDIKRGFNSENSVSAKAYHKASELSNIAYIPQLFEYLSCKQSSENRENAYFILGNLLRKTKDNMQIQMFVDCLKAEKKSNVLAEILDKLSEIVLSELIDINPIFDLMENKDWKIRHNAILALSKANQDVAKENIREIIRSFRERKDKLDVVYATAVIGQIGDNSDIAMLQELLSSKVKDVRDSAKFAIQSLQSK